MGTQNNHTDQDMINLKTEADQLGVDYSPTIGYETLSTRVKGAKNEKERLSKEKPKTLSKHEEMLLKARSLSKVHITNLDRDNAGATTVFAGVHNMYLDLSRVIPLGMDIALEEALIKDIEKRKMLVPKPVLDKTGSKTGNFEMVEAPMYAVARLS